MGSELERKIRKIRMRILERVILYSLIVGFCITIGYLKSVQNRLERDLKACSDNQVKMLDFCKENEATKDRIRKALSKNNGGIDDFNSVLDILFQGHKK